jgi:hypothetical protein
MLIASRNPPDKVRTINIAGGNLFEIAAQYLGDATHWNRIARLNGLWDFQVTGITTLKIPPVDRSAGNGGIHDYTDVVIAAPATPPVITPVGADAASPLLNFSQPGSSQYLPGI